MKQSWVWLLMAAICVFLFISGISHARIYFLGSGDDVYENPLTDIQPDHPTPPPCTSQYRYTCNPPRVGVGASCNGKYAVPCICDPQYNKTCTAETIGDGPSCEGKYAACKCGYSFIYECTGKYEGVGTACRLNPSKPLYQSCICKPQYYITSATCNGDYHPSGESCDGKYETCVCNPDRFTEACDGDGQVGTGPSCQGKYKSCLCAPEFQWDASNCFGDDKPSGESCEGKYESCLCNPEVFDKLCDAAGEVGVGAQCGVNNGYKECACEPRFSFDASTCDLEDHTLEGPSCGGKYETCQCVLEKFPETCEGDLIGVGEECQGQFKSCCNNKCLDGYSTDKPDVPYLSETTDCGTVCYMIEPRCADGFSVDVTRCDEGYSLLTHGSYDGKACNKCAVTACASGFSTSKPNEASCGTAGGWLWEQNGKSGDMVCGKCTARACATGSRDKPNVGACGGSGAAGWDWSIGSYAGDEVCGVCTAKACALSGYDTSAKTCGEGFEVDINGKSGDEDCSKCVDKVCPVGFSTDYQSANDCGSKSHAEGWDYSSNGLSGSLKCGKCVAKTCASGSTDKPNVASCGSSGASGWDWSSAGYAGDIQCGVCTEKACGGDYTPGNKNCGIGYIEEIDPSGMHGDEVCAKCVVSACPSGEVGESVCSGAGWSFSPSGSMLGTEKCGTCVAKACPIGYDTTPKTCTEGFELEVNGQSGNNDCSKCVIKACEAGYSTDYQSVMDCGDKMHFDGWIYSSSGQSGTLICGKCTVKTCSWGTTDLPSVDYCGTTGAAGWTWASNGFSGDKVCGACALKTCPANTATEKYSTSYTSTASCESTWVYGTTTFFAGDKMCGKCTSTRIITPLPIVYVKNDTIETLNYIDTNRKNEIWGIRSGGVAVQKTSANGGDKTYWSTAQYIAGTVHIGGYTGSLPTRAQFAALQDEHVAFNNTVTLLKNQGIEATQWFYDYYWTSQLRAATEAYIYRMIIVDETWSSNYEPNIVRVIVVY